MDNRPIGIFDSGVGGMTVFSEIIKELPNEDIIYLGDTKRFPYGNKSKETIIELSKNNAEFLIQQNVKIIIVACGTATSQALEELKKIYKIPIIGIISPTVEYVVKDKDTKRIGVIATPGTIRSNEWEKSIKRCREDIEVINKGCSLLAPMAEEGWIDNEIARLTIKEYLQGLKNIDKLILGCTHYPLFKDIIKEIFENDTEIIDTGKKLSKYLHKFLNENELKNDGESASEYKIYLTDIETSFVNVAVRLLDNKILVKPKLANIE